jgi:hypothetical protein
MFSITQIYTKAHNFLSNPETFCPYYIANIVIYLIKKSSEADAVIVNLSLKEILAPFMLIYSTYQNIAGHLRDIAFSWSNFSFNTIWVTFTAILAIAFVVAIYMIGSAIAVVFSNILGRPIYNFIARLNSKVRWGILIFVSILIFKPR